MADNNSISDSDLVNRQMCILCQKRLAKPKDNLSMLTDRGRIKVVQCAEERQLLNDTRFSHDILRILNHLKKDDKCQLFWFYHRSCYATFTSAQNIKALKNSERKGQKRVTRSQTTSSTPQVTRSNTGKTNWNMCLFCQKAKEKEQTKLIMTTNMNEKIIEIAQYDYKLHVRISAVGDLIAAEGKYHSSCLLSLQKSSTAWKNAEEDLEMLSLPLIQICKELRVAASLEQALKLDDVWKRYIQIGRSVHAKIPASFESRRATFQNKLKEKVGDVYFFFQPINRELCERDVLLIPTGKGNKLAVEDFYDDDVVKMPNCQSYEQDDYRTIVHTALKLRGDLLAHPGHSGFEISKEASAKVLPDSLRLFMNVLLKGPNAIDAEMDKGYDNEDDGGINDECFEGYSNACCDIGTSIAQDIVYAVSGGKKLTPKHIGLALTIHQATRSKKLVTLLHAAGHCINYREVLKADCSLAKLALQTYDVRTGAIVPQNFKSDDSDGTGPILHVTADNIDIITDTLDGKKTFHATQMVAFQRKGCDPSHLLNKVRLSRDTTLQIPKTLNELAIVPFFEKKEPQFAETIDVAWYNSCDPFDFETISKEVLDSKIEDLTYLISRTEADQKIGWTEFNRKETDLLFEKSAMAFLPLILNPAHELSTLQTVLNRCISLADGLNKKHVVVTADQAVYCKLIELRWASPIFKDRIVLRMGGLHISLNFMKVIGKHMSGTGLRDLWVSSGLMAEGSVAKVFEGKAYAKGMRAHKLTLQALWRVLHGQFLDFLEEEDLQEAQSFISKVGSTDDLKDYLSYPTVLKYLTAFLKQRSEEDKNFSLWWSYIDMVLTLLMFTRGIRGADFKSYFCALTEMLPFSALYDHGNYLKSMAVYIADLKQLPVEIENGFLTGDFVVQRTDKKFSQVDPDHAQEWVVGCCKSSSGGIIGITQDERTLQKWALSLYWRTEISNSTYALFMETSSGMDVHKEETAKRRARDLKDENVLMEVIETYNIFSPHAQSALINNVATKDIATQKITDALINAKARGTQLVQEFVGQRLTVRDQTGSTTVSYYATLHKNNALTLQDLYKEKLQTDTQKVMKTDRDFLQKLIAAYDGKRIIDLKKIFKHELCNIPISLATITGDLRPAEKASLIKEITRGLNCPKQLQLKENENSDNILIIDGMAFIISFGRPQNIATFGDYAERFVNKIAIHSRYYKEVHLVFDRYRKVSVKDATRKKRTKGLVPVRRIITDSSVPLPSNWSNFLALPDNKSDLCRFLSEQILQYSNWKVAVIVSGGFEQEDLAKSTEPLRNVTCYNAYHEEADTRMILHSVNCTAENLVVMARDTDVVLLFVYHFQKMKFRQVWIKGGTARDIKYIPVHEIVKNLRPKQLNNLLAFHAITGCDTTSKLASITKVGAWKHFQGDECLLLERLGQSPIEEDVLFKAEKFVIQLYKGNSGAASADEARSILFGMVKKPENLPPTTDALRLHLKRCHYQVNVWENAHLANPCLPKIEECGWDVKEGKVVPILMTLDPIPKSCPDINICHCKGQCNSSICSCRKANVPCIKLCLSCRRTCLNSVSDGDECD